MCSEKLNDSTDSQIGLTSRVGSSRIRRKDPSRGNVPESWTEVARKILNGSKNTQTTYD